MPSTTGGTYKRLHEAGGGGSRARCGVENHCNAHDGLSPATTFLSPAPRAQHPTGGANEAPRLFDALAAKPPPSDYSAYYTRLPGFADVEKANTETLFNQRVMLCLCGAQTTCACGFLLMQDTTPDSTGKALLLFASLVVFVSGVFGFAGAWKKSRLAMHWFFISQLWSISVVLTQVVRGQLTNANQEFFCSQRSPGHAACMQLSPGWVAVSTAIACVIIYMSTFYADALSEALQDEVEKKDTMLITKFVWLMQKKTTVGIHRFEDLIHKEFQELVEMGYLKLKPTVGSPSL